MIERGRLVGIGDGPPCYGEGKLYWAERWAADRGIAMDEAAAYADNWSDRALLERVGRAVVVRPHGKLRRLARRPGLAHRPAAGGRASRGDRATGALEPDRDEIGRRRSAIIAGPVRPVERSGEHRRRRPDAWRDLSGGS